jgi:endoglucanase
MLRSVFENDEDTFIGAWSWTRDHLQTRTQDNLISWLWGERDGKEQIVESANATDADLDIALALILASRKWDNSYYEKEAKLIIDDIWKKSVLNINGRYYLSAGEGFKKPDGLVMNPSYFSPAAYRVFDSIDNRPWEKLANDTYFALNEINKLKENEKNIPVNWIFITNGGDLSSAKKYVENYPDAYGFDAFRVFWRVGLDAKWFSNKNAYDYLKNSQEFYKEEFTEKKEFKSIYSLSGKPEVNYSNISVNTGPLSIFSVVNRKIADDIYRTLIKPKYSSKGYWGDGKNYYDQNWVWFGTALYSNNLPLYK